MNKSEFDARIEKFKKNIRDSAGANKNRVENLEPEERNKELCDEAKSYFWFMDKSGFEKKDVDFSLLMEINRETILKFLEVTE